MEQYLSNIRMHFYWIALVTLLVVLGAAAGPMLAAFMASMPELASLEPIYGSMAERYYRLTTEQLLNSSMLAGLIAGAIMTLCVALRQRR